MCNSTAPKPKGRPAKIPGARKVNTYLDEGIIAIATRLVLRNVSLGTRVALAITKQIEDQQGSNMISLQLAIEARDEAKARMNAAKQHSKKWNEAEEDYEFWSNKVAVLDVMHKQGMIK